VLLPLLFTLDKLISHGYLDELLSSEDGTFLSSLMACLESEAKGCSDVKRLLAIVTVTLSLLRPHLQTVDIVSLLKAEFLLLFIAGVLTTLSFALPQQTRCEKRFFHS